MATELDYLEEDQEDTQRDKFLTFSIDEEIYGLDISYVLEIIGVQEITHVPRQLPFIKGVINLRGKIIPVMDIRLRFIKELRDYDELTCIVVLAVNELVVGIIVDTVVEVLSIQTENISPPPRFSNTTDMRFISGIGKVGNGVKLLLNAKQLIANEQDEVRLEDALINREVS